MTIPFVIGDKAGVFNPCPHIRRTKDGRISGAYACLLRASETPLKPGYSYHYYYEEDYDANPVEEEEEGPDVVGGINNEDNPEDED